MFPFFSLNNYQLYNLINYTKKTSKGMKNTSDPLTPQKLCSVCLKKTNKIELNVLVANKMFIRNAQD